MRPDKDKDTPIPCRVEIANGGHSVVVEAADTLTAVGRKALDLWKATGNPTPTETGGVAGFASGELAGRTGLMPDDLSLPDRLAEQEGPLSDPGTRQRRPGPIGFTC